MRPGGRLCPYGISIESPAAVSILSRYSHSATRIYLPNVDFEVRKIDLPRNVVGLRQPPHFLAYTFDAYRVTDLEDVSMMFVMSTLYVAQYHYRCVPL